MQTSKLLFSTLTASLLLIGCSGGDSGPGSSVDPNTVSIGGEIVGLSGEIEITINGQSEWLTANGEFTAETRVQQDENYRVALGDMPEGLSCTIENATGVATVNINNILITCEGLETVAYSLKDLNFETQTPSVISFIFNLIDRETNTAIQGINKDNIKDFLTLTENGSAVSSSESFLEVETLRDLQADYELIFAIDISSSLSSDDLAAITASIKSVLRDEQGNSMLEPNQKVTILTFDSTVTTLIKESIDIDSLFEVLDSISVGGNSTNLYGAIKAGAEAWDNEVSLSQIKYGSLMLFTDGNDTSELVSKEDALAAVSDKDIFFVTVGSETDTTVLKEFTDRQNIFSISEFGELNSAVSAAIERVKTFENGLYVLSYATPKRAGSHTLTITARDDYRCDTAVTDDEQNQLANSGTISGCQDQVSYDFSAAGFTDATPALKITGPSRSVDETVAVSARVRWTRETPVYNWNVQVCEGEITTSETIEAGISTMSFTRVHNELTIAYYTVQDDLSGTFGEGYLVMSDEERDFQFERSVTVEDFCNH